LDEVDKELEKRGHAFARYADDCNVYVRSKRAGERVMETLRRLFRQLRLRINESKSAVAPVFDRKFLGYRVRIAEDGSVCLGTAEKSLARAKERIRLLTKRTCGRSLTTVIGELRGYLLGWMNYFHLSETPWTLENLDGWIRHRLRALQLKQWKTTRTVVRK